MIFGVLKDIKEGENRVICTPVEVASIKAAGHTVLVQSGAGVGSGFSDEKYAAAGGRDRLRRGGDVEALRLPGQGQGDPAR